MYQMSTLINVYVKQFIYFLMFKKGKLAATNMQGFVISFICTL